METVLALNAFSLPTFIYVCFVQAAEIERQIALETKADKHIQKLLLLG